MEEYIQSYYNGDLDKGRALLEELTSSSEHKDIYDAVLWNAKFYIRKCPGEKMKILKPRIFTEKAEGQKKFGINPFIVHDQKTQQIVVGLRVLNYAANDGVNPTVAQGKIVTKYEIYVYDEDLHNLISHFPLTDNLEKLVERDWRYATGTEDYRVVPSNNPDILIGTCTGIETHQEGPVRMCKFQLRIQREKDRIVGLVAENLVPLGGYDSGNKQKNWVLISDRSAPSSPKNLVYSTTPLVLLLDEQQGLCTEKLRVPNRFFNFRNGTPFISVCLGEEGYLTVAHTSSDRDRRIYYHRFFYFSKDFELLKYSPLFYFESNNTIEFASDIIYHEDHNAFYIAYGYRDRVAYIHKISGVELASFLGY